MRTQMIQGEDFEYLLEEVEDLTNLGPEDEDEANDMIFDGDDDFELDSLDDFNDLDDYDDDF